MAADAPRYGDLDDAGKLERLEAWCDVFDIPRDVHPVDDATSRAVVGTRAMLVAFSMPMEHLELVLEQKCPYAQYCVPGESIVVNCRCRRCQELKRGAWDPRR